ncbi:MAG: hypothetical protein GWP91_04960, partial [Rhodobacterales bacterium]|nr:hypothetical protein [Rhodobacterales bacterium]
LWEVRLVVGVGSYADPEGQEGLASLTLNMMDEGAGERSAADISNDLNTLAGNVSSFLDSDSAFVTASGIKRNMAETLDIWTDVIRDPTFDMDEWKIVKERTLSDIKLADESPNAIARRAWRYLIWGKGYIGRHATAGSIESLKLKQLQSFYKTYLGPDSAILLVGGDTTLEEVLPLLEERLGDWHPEGAKVAEVKAAPPAIPSEVIYLIDKPGAAQSVIQSGTLVGTLEEKDHFDFLVANRMFGRSFTGRVNMNLREDKGYTYGARCYITHRHGPGQMVCGASVRTDVTGESLAEFRTEIADVLDERSLTDDEIATARNSLAYGYPNSFETTGPQLDLEFEIWRYGRSEDWAAEYVPSVRRVTTAGANQAIQKWLQPDHTFWLIVGDKKEIMTGLEKSGLPIIELNRHGRPLAAN